MPTLLTRDRFREAVFTRDGHKCVICGAPAVDAHHIMERRLWPDGGYYLDNGASLCGLCHLAAEETRIEIETLLQKIGVRARLTPPHLYDDTRYDKWGNVILESGVRVPGELFHDLSVQKVLAFRIRDGNFATDMRKYPRTFHLPWSPGVTSDDRVMPNLLDLLGGDVVITEKMDGENTTMARDYIHARSLTSDNHPSRDWVKNFWGQIRFQIPHGMRVCGENLYARHSIAYANLASYFLGFSVWERNTCLSWDETVEWFQLLDIESVPVLFRGEMDEGQVEYLKAMQHASDFEGYVVRVSQGFELVDFPTRVGKWVRANHVQTHGHWMRQALVPNGLAR